MLVQSIREMGPADAQQVYLVRVVIDVGDEVADVVTAYRTRKIARYWRGIQ